MDRLAQVHKLGPIRRPPLILEPFSRGTNPRGPPNEPIEIVPYLIDRGRHRLEPLPEAPNLVDIHPVSDHDCLPFPSLGSLTNQLPGKSAKVT